MPLYPAITRTPAAGALPVAGSTRKLLVGALAGVAFAALTYLGANIRVPLQPVPITLQTLFVLLSGAIAGPRLGATAQALYVGAGMLGVPVFAGSALGLAVLAGPTGGYLVGFLVAPLVVGYLIRRRESAWWQCLAFSLGSLVILTLGVAHLTAFHTHNLRQSLIVGYFPFVIGDALKILAAVSIYRSCRALRHTRLGHPRH